MNWKTDHNSNIYNYLIEAEMYLVITIMAEYYQKSIITAQILPFIFHKNFLELILLLSWRFVMYHSDCLFNSSDFNMPESWGNAVNVKRTKITYKKKKKMNESPLCLYGSFSKLKNAFTGKPYVNKYNFIKEQTKARHYVDKLLPL